MNHLHSTRQNTDVCAHVLDGLVHELEVVDVEGDAGVVLERFFDRDCAVVRLVSACIVQQYYQLLELRDKSTEMFFLVYRFR